MPLLVPGILAPPINRLTVDGQKAVVLFIPSGRSENLQSHLMAFQDHMEDFAALNTSLTAICDGSMDNIPIRGFSLHETESGLAAAYGVVGQDGELLPAAFILDETGIVRRAYAPDQTPDLPNPAVVLRAIKKMVDQPSPPPVNAQDWQLGPNTAPVVVIEYSDYQCPPCQEIYKLLAEVLPKYEDRTVWVHRHLPLRSTHPLAQQAAEAAEAAGAQGQFWEMHRRLFESAGKLEPENLLAFASELGLDLERFKTELESQFHRQAVSHDLQEAVRHGIKLPPKLFINSLVYDGPRTPAGLHCRIDSLLACQAQLKT